MAQQRKAPSGEGRLGSRLLEELHPSRSLPALTTGLLIGVLVVVVSISFAALVFSGELSDYLPQGVGMVLFGAIIMGALVALTSSFPSMVANPQDAPAAILAVTGASIASTLTVSSATDQVFATVLGAIVLSTVLTGVFFLALGLFRLGGLIRYIPYPVVGGFLAGTGWLLVKGSIGMMTDASLALSQLPTLFQPDLLVRWLPGLVFAILLLGITRAYSHFFITPGLLLVALGIFYALLALTGTSVAEAGARGWLLGPFPSGGLWKPVDPSLVAEVNWPVLLGQIGGLMTVALVSAVSMLLNASGIELAANQDIDFDRELQAAGIANMAAGLGGGIPGFHALSFSVLGPRTGARSRLVGLSSATFCGVALIFGASILSFFPKVVLGGLLLFLGLAFLVEWVYDAWFKLPRVDYFIVLLILVVVGVFGYLEGVGVGMLAAVALFVFQYSRVSVVKHAFSGIDYRSNVERPRLYHQLLHRKGRWLYILELQGFIFFGTANDLLDLVRDRLSDPETSTAHYVVLDFRLVSGLDSSAMLSFERMKHLAHAKHTILVFSSLPPEIERQLRTGVLDEEGRDTIWRVFPDLDRAVEWCEDEAIKTFESVGLAARPRTLMQQLQAALPETIAVADLMAYFKREDIEQGHMVIRQGTPPEGLYFIESGRMTVWLEMDGGNTVRLRTTHAGALVGEMGTYLGHPASASVVADEPSTLLRLSADALQEMERKDPEITAAFHRFVVELLAERLADSSRTMEALLR